jgi:hypothetical protein
MSPGKIVVAMCLRRRRKVSELGARSAKNPRRLWMTLILAALNRSKKWRATTFATRELPRQTIGSNTRRQAYSPNGCQQRATDRGLVRAR